MKQVMNGIRYVEVPNGEIMEDPTNMFIIGDDPVMLIDTGSLAGIDAVFRALDQLGNPDVRAILLTHVHVDHGENTEQIRDFTGAPVRFHQFERAELKQSEHSVTLDEPITEGEIIEHAGFRFESVLTPGHAAGHLAFVEQERNFGIVGDLVTGSGSSAVFPPWGDLTAYIASMQLIADRGVNPLLPSHGDPVTNGPDALRHFIRRRLMREQQILDLIDGQTRSAEEIRDLLYEDLPVEVLNDVTGNVILHLKKLENESRVRRFESNGAARFVRVS